MTGIEIGRRLLSSLRHHFRRIRFPGNASRPELLPLLVVLGLARPPIVDLPAEPEALVIYLAAGFQLPGLFGLVAALVGHWDGPSR